MASVGAGYLAHVDEGALELCREDACQPRIGQVALAPLDDAAQDVVTLSRRVLEGFRRTAGREAARRALLACAADDAQAPEAIHRYMRLGFAEPEALRRRATDARLLAVDDLARFVLGELEHTRQFVRFSHLKDGSWLAVFEPAANTVPLSAEHFARRMGPERFCLVDPRHRMAAFHERSHAHCAVVRLDEGLARRLVEREVAELADDERSVRALWQRFYDRVSLPGREDYERGYELQTKYVPRRLRTHMTEFRQVPETGAQPTRTIT